MNNEWKGYMEYLKNWVNEHGDERFYGQSPVCFDEWCDMEYLEEDEDA